MVVAAPKQAPRVYSQSEVQSMASEGRYVYTCNGRVYDVKVEEIMHPGGRDVLESYKGQDISAAFKGQCTVAHLHSRGARALLERYCVGVLEGSEDAAAAGGMALPDADLVDEGKPLLPQVVHLDPDTYLAWVDAPSTGHPVMFDNAFVERMTCTQWYVVPLLWVPIAAALLWRGWARGGVPLVHLPALVAIGVLVWQLIEYSIHRWLFHLKPTTPEGIKWHFMLHGHHHKYPMDFDRLVFPPVPAGLVMALFYNLLCAIVPWGYASALLGGGILGYVVYDTTHWALHSNAWDPFVTQILRTSHMDHHYVNDKVGYGISSTLYDILFGTLSPQVRKVV
ncbi:Inositolphosphorylceramide-B C-26 hydroxylase [Monoraphidium neglectum]|uniref:Fatty acid 2-hydroxylase n=1 Tax=Monoraphidium neglectum TaxID=145388 RepID=A0A0D2ML16_9CHLO|nr:Inositolphosphorylceramide-B C-26 hydroxylase [Monoraphidium neglectum]KIZ03590.1 Inositolphosphorylceramide-B C-26 hydroxylase [Monoraphidium neglectum]|eukprot:XP_013902609.1 Inositolphosphorylceramide-B C-26 hydroxylase [Monoraphidium neglectum]